MTGSQPPDPHPLVTLLTRPFSNWLRVPTWGAAAGLLLLLVALHASSAARSEEQGRAIDQFMGFVRTVKAFHGDQIARQQRAKTQLDSAAAATRASARHLVGADSLERLAEAAAAAVGQARNAQDSIGFYQLEIAHLTEVNQQLRASVAGAQDAATHALRADSLAEARADAAVARADSVTAAGHRVVETTSCRLISLHPCLPNIHIGPYVGYEVAPRQGGSVGLAVVWTP